MHGSPAGHWGGSPQDAAVSSARGGGEAPSGHAGLPNPVQHGSQFASRSDSCPTLCCSLGYGEGRVNLKRGTQFKQSVANLFPMIKSGI